jgi:ectoine hydroxylase
MDIYPTRKVSEPTLIFRRDPVVYGGPDEGPIDDLTLKSFAENGYLTEDDLLTRGEVEVCQAELDRLSSDDAVRHDKRTLLRQEGGEVRSIFEVHKISEVFDKLVRDPRIVDRARQLLGSEVYVHQSRVDHRPGFEGEDFFWHSDFETWHAEDGMPRMRAVSVSIALADNYEYNGGLMVMPGSHRTFVSCLSEGSVARYRESLCDERIGTPDTDSLTMLVNKYGIEVLTGPAGSATIVDCNCMHGSSGNMTPYPRSTVFIVYNSVENACTRPFAAMTPRPEYVGARDFTPVG